MNRVAPIGAMGYKQVIGHFKNDSAKPKTT